MTTHAAVRTPGTARVRARAAWRPAVVVLVAVGLFFLYLRQSGSVGVSSDGASIVLQARAVLHGNLLLHNWRVADVSFYTTELPQYALIESVLGLGAWVVHVGAAMTYTLLVLLAAWLAKGRARGRAAWPRPCWPRASWWRPSSAPPRSCSCRRTTPEPRCRCW